MSFKAASLMTILLPALAVCQGLEPSAIVHSGSGKLADL